MELHGQLLGFRTYALLLYPLIVYAGFRSMVGARAERNALILDSITDGVAAVDRKWCVTYTNRMAERIAGRPREELVGKDLRELLPGLQDSLFFEHYQRALDEQVAVHFEGQSSMVEAWLEIHAYPSPQGLTIFFRDVTERHEHEERLRSLSLLDELTGLYNRRGFFTLAQTHCKLAERKHRGALLVFLDMDGLKQINDTLGHAAGDRALEAIAHALRECFRESDIIGRLGGDEFAAFVLETDRGSAPHLLHRLRAGLEHFNEGGSLSLPIAVSVGTAYFDPDAPTSVEDLVSIADREMYQEKRGKVQTGNDEL